MIDRLHVVTRLSYEWRRIQQQSPAALASKLSSRFLGLTIWLVLLPLTVVLHVVGFRRVTIFTDRIGHLSLEPDCLLKEESLGLIPKRRWFVLAPPERVANKHLLNYWKPLIRIYENKTICFILASMSCWRLMSYDISRYILVNNKAPTAYQIYSLWGDRASLLTLTEEDIEWGDMMLRELGLPDNAWFVCLHVREPGFSPVDEELHAHRNGSIVATIPAIKEITRRGGWVIRIGDSTMQPLQPLSQVIDYANHPMKNDRADIILCARARFLIGNTSGIALVSSVFGVPCAIANAIPTPTLWFNAQDISIPKLLWSENLGRYLNFDQAMATPIAEYRYAALYRNAGIRVDENSAEDIYDLIIEMLDRLEGRFFETEDDRKLQQLFLTLFRLGHYSYETTSHIGTLFLRRHRNLLGAMSPEAEFSLKTTA